MADKIPHIYGGVMIVKRDREPPSEWSDSAIEELIEHAIDLAANGNPAGFFVDQGLQRAMQATPTEDYVAYRTWIEANADLVRTAWQYEVRSDY